ncbi:uncharacterized protein LOC130727890 [Lotus japonicus]|uniref:uncharacterized protein LOC130727890 n=1 Tax=Lotus japonicus TaxID=34305 RepID=UPI002588E210|nr:uncharacterized protein LOC130727890 [Lotus japonicus]
MYSSMKPNRRPPLPKSPIRLRSSRRPLRSSDSTSLLQTPPGSLTKSQKPLRSPDLRPEYRTISYELRALAKMVHNEFGDAGSGSENVAVGVKKNPDSLFERGRFYDEYSARRNERLKRKKGVAVEEGSVANKATKAAFGLGVNMESGKKSSTARKIGSLRKSVSAAYSMEVSETPRYMLRSMTKENKKPPLAGKFEKSVVGGEKKIGARRVGRI